MRPSPERAQTSDKQRLEGLIVSMPHSLEQIERRFRIERGQAASCRLRSLRAGASSRLFPTMPGKPLWNRGHRMISGPYYP